MFNHIKVLSLALFAFMLLPTQAHSESIPDLEETQISDYGKNEFSGIVEEDTSNQKIHNSGQSQENGYSRYPSDYDNNAPYEEPDYSTDENTPYGDRSTGTWENIGNGLADTCKSIGRVFAGMFGGLWNVMTGNS